MKRYILDLNGVVQEHPVKQVLRFGFGEMITFRVSPIMFVKILARLARNNENFTKKEEKFLVRYYETNQHIKTPFLPGAEQAVCKIKAEFPIHICSANSFSLKSDVRYENFLTGKFGKFEDVHFVKPGETKLSYYKKVKSEHPNDEIIVVDDSERHIVAAKSLGLKTLWINKKCHESLASAIER